MIVFLIILLLALIGVVVYLSLFKKDLFFGNSITSKVEKRKRILGEVEVLKKEQKVKYDETLKSYDVRKAEAVDAINAQINSYKALIKNLEVEKVNKGEMLDQERKVALDKVNNSYDQRIVSKQNQAKKLGYYIDAEQKNIEDVIEPDQPNAPTAPTALAATNNQKNTTITKKQKSKTNKR